MVTDTEMLNADDKSISPEHNLKDDSIQWEKFDRAEIYKILKHMEASKKMRPNEFVDRWMPPTGEFEANETDEQYGRHIQKKPREIHNRSEDNQIGVRMAVSRNLRMNPPMEYDKWLDTLPKDMQKEHARQIAEDRADYIQHKDQYNASQPPAPDPTAIIEPDRYRKFILNPNTPEWKELYTGPQHPYSYEDWEAELRRSMLINHLGAAIPQEAQVALDKYNQLKKIESVEMVSPLLNRPDHTNTATTSRYHERMLRLYGARYEPSEHFSVAPALRQNKTQSALDQVRSSF